MHIEEKKYQVNDVLTFRNRIASVLSENIDLNEDNEISLSSKI